MFEIMAIISLFVLAVMKIWEFFEVLQEKKKKNTQKISVETTYYK